MEYLFNTFTEYTKLNPVIGGMISLWLLGVSSWLLRGVPKATYNYLFRNFTTKLLFDNSLDTSWWNRQNYDAYHRWLLNYPKISYPRNYRLSTVNDDILFNAPTAKIVSGMGRTYFIYKGRLFSSYSYTTKKENTVDTLHTRITLFSRNKTILDDFFNEWVCIKTQENNLLLDYKPVDDEWHASKNQYNPRRPNTVIVDKVIKDRLFRQLDEFKDSKQWCTKHSFAHKLTYLLHGIPGTGKTSVIKMIATYLNYNLAIINLNKFQGNLVKALSALPSNTVLALEDFDDNTRLHSRDKTGNKGMISSVGVTLSDILNALDGISNLDGIVIVLTTNYLDRLDNAIYRKGRVDHLIEIKALTHVEIVDYINLMYQDVVIPDVIFKDILGCDIQSIYMEHRNDYNGFISALQKVD